uniref:Uncharacterized protein n=2 Tax=Oryza TaxID=4527 RepID=A0A0D3EL01_9ORYZ
MPTPNGTPRWQRYSAVLAASYFANPQSRNINIIKIAIGFLEVIGRREMRACKLTEISLVHLIQ